MRIARPAVAIMMITMLITACSTLSSLVQNSLRLTEFRVQGSQLLMNGPINSQTLDQFENIYVQNPEIKTLVEQDVPGSLDDETMIALAYRVRELGLNTHITRDSVIYSGGVDLFLAGVNRTMEHGAKIGVHSWSNGVFEAKDFPRNAPEHKLNRKYIEDMLGDDAFYWFTIYAAPADDIHEMTAAEITKYKLLTK